VTTKSKPHGRWFKCLEKSRVVCAGLLWEPGKAQEVPEDAVPMLDEHPVFERVDAPASAEKAAEKADEKETVKTNG